ncbi:hypothetical protein HQ560_09125, partial [bacterium]|nr:hypothetical protein [bacterium]
MSDRILAIGIEAEHERIQCGSFHAVTPLTDYAHAIIDPSSVSDLWRNVEAGPHGRLTTNAETDGGLGRTLIHVVRRRRQEVAELVSGGGSLVCILRSVGKPLSVRRRTQKGPAINIVHTYSWLPEEASLSRLVIAGEVGGEIRPTDADSLAWRFIEAQGDAAQFTAFVANEQLDPSWHTCASDRLGRPVAFEVALGEGRVIFIPPIAGTPEERGAIIAELLAPSDDERQPTAPPEWLAEHFLAGQTQLARQIAELEEEFASLQAQLNEARVRHDELATYSLLLYASHAGELAEPVAAAFRLFGFEVEPGDEDTLEIRSEEGEAVVALHADEEAVDSDPYFILQRRTAAEGAPPKGIIVGNAYCSTAPEEREAAFSDLLHRGALHRDMGL